MTTASSRPSTRDRPNSSDAIPSITVSTRLRSADRPATWPAARGAGVIPSSSTTPSTSAAGKAMRRPAIWTMSSRSAILPAFRCGLAAAGRGPAQRADEGDAVVTIDAVVILAGKLGTRADPHHLGGGDAALRLVVGAGDQDVGRDALAGGDDFVAEALDQRPKHVVHPGIALRQGADRRLLLARPGVGERGEEPIRIDDLDLAAVDQCDARHLAGRRRRLELDRHGADVDDVGKAVGELGGAVGEPEDAQRSFLGRSGAAGERQDRAADRD